MTARTHRCEFHVTFPYAKEVQDLRCAAVHTTSSWQSWWSCIAKYESINAINTGQVQNSPTTQQVSNSL